MIQPKNEQVFLILDFRCEILDVRCWMGLFDYRSEWQLFKILLDLREGEVYCWSSF